MNEQHMLEIVEQYSRQKDTEYGDIKIMRVPNNKTVYVEQTGESGRAVMMNEYKVDGVIYWAGYSSRSQTIYISQAA
jgi:hypothetical protein